MKYLNALNFISGIGSQKIRTLLSYFPEPENIWQAPLAELKKSGLNEKLAERIFYERSNINPDEEWDKLERSQIKVISVNSAEYPKLLKEIPNPPYIIYVRGKYDFNRAPLISIVGSRKFTPYGQQAAESFSYELAKAGITIVSGMAIGIDTFSHQGAIKAQGKTIAVLGNGLGDSDIQPRINFSLSREIMENGLLVSDYPLGTSASPTTFPARNRIIAGLSLGTLVIEAEGKSGALITSDLALEFNREVMAIPGSIYSPASIGTNRLIQKGAKLITSVNDILEELNLIDTRKEISSTPKIPENPQEEILLKILSYEPLHVDKIIKLSKLKTSEVTSTLLMMEMKSWVKNIGSQSYIII